MFAKMKTGTKVLAGFGIAIVFTAVVGISGWNRLARVARLVTVSEDAGSAVRDLLDARREEKNFELRGFEKYGSDTLNSAQKWEEHQKELLAKLEALRLSSDLDQKQGSLAVDALSAATEYGKAFAGIMASRTVQDKAMEGWRSTGWEVTRQIEEAATGVIAPAREAAEKAKDAKQIANWARIGRELDDEVVKPFLLLRTTAVYFILTKADKEWESYQTHLDKVKSGAAAWTEAVKNQPELQKAGKMLLTHLEGYEAAGKQFREAVLQAREADVVAVAKARTVEDNCEKLRADVNERVAATMANAKAIILMLVVAALVVVGAFAFLIARSVSKALTALIGEAKRLTEAAVGGKLQTRGNPELVSLEFRPIIEGINATLDAVIGPVERGRRVRRPHLEGRYPREDHRQLQRRLQRDQEQPQSVHRRGERPGCRRQHAVGRRRGRPPRHAGRRLEAPGRLPQDRPRRERHHWIVGRAYRLDARSGHDYRQGLHGPVHEQDRADVIGLPKQQIIGTKCYNHFKTSHCRTANCACGRAMQEADQRRPKRTLIPAPITCEISYTGVPVKDKKGSVIGALEIVTDQTAVKNAAKVADKQAQFQNAEVAKLIVSLDKVAKGDLNVETSVGATDEHTKAIGENFAKINGSLDASVEAVNALVADANMLSKAAVEGKLATRADASKHQGDFRKIVQGVNDTLDAVIGPLNVAAEYVDRISKGDIPEKITDSYNGDFNEIKNNLNQCIDAVNGLINAT